MTRDNIHKVAHDLLAALPPECKAVKAYIFGSRARDDAGSNSDLDILIELEGKVPSYMKNIILDNAWELSLKHGLVISPVIVSQEEFEHGALSVSPLVRNIRKEGIEIAA